jgi:hypothetical protein
MRPNAEPPWYLLSREEFLEALLSDRELNELMGIEYEPT